MIRAIEEGAHVMRRRTSAGVLVILVCACAASPKAPSPATATATTQAPVVATAEREKECGAGRLPRVTETTFGDGTLQGFLASAERGTVAVTWDGQHATVVEECRLDGQYAQARGIEDRGRFWATNRVLFRVDEVTTACKTATHILAAFATGSRPIREKENRSPARAGGVLVPLPCPSASDSKPSTGCIASGMTGAQRRARANALMVGLNPEMVRPAETAKLLEIYSLIPDDYWGIFYAGKLNEADCPLFSQGNWLASQFEMTQDAEYRPVARPLAPALRRQPPRLVWSASNQDCIYRPVFLWCFDPFFDPLFSGPGFWTPAEKAQR
jgi:hypothetical protein